MNKCSLQTGRSNLAGSWDFIKAGSTPCEKSKGVDTLKKSTQWKDDTKTAHK